MLASIDLFDTKLSNYVHSVDNKYVTTILYPFARMFNP